MDWKEGFSYANHEWFNNKRLDAVQGRHDYASSDYLPGSTPGKIVAAVVGVGSVILTNVALFGRADPATFMVLNAAAITVPPFIAGGITMVGVGLLAKPVDAAVTLAVKAAAYPLDILSAGMAERPLRRYWTRDGHKYAPLEDVPSRPAVHKEPPFKDSLAEASAKASASPGVTFAFDGGTITDHTPLDRPLTFINRSRNRGPLNKAKSAPAPG